MAPSAPKGTGPVEINITYANGKYDAPQNADVDNDELVFFHASQPCSVYYTPPDAFRGHSGLLKLQKGKNPPLKPSDIDFNINYCVTDPGSICTPRRSTNTGPYTIKVGSGTKTAPAAPAGKVIIVSGGSGAYDCNPQQAQVPSRGVVYFDVVGAPCSIHYTPISAFVGETGTLHLSTKPHGPYTPSLPHIKILYCVADFRKDCTPLVPTGPYTIKVGSGKDEDSK